LQVQKFIPAHQKQTLKSPGSLAIFMLKLLFCQD